MKKLSTYRQFLVLNEQLTKKASISEIMDAYKNDAQARAAINGSIQANSSYSSVLNAIKSYWTNQIPLLKNKPKDQLTDTEVNMLDTAENQFKSGNMTRDVEDYAMKKLIGGHLEELEYDKDAKKLVIKGYTETQYDKSIKSK
jgi:hypothetical protein